MAPYIDIDPNNQSSTSLITPYRNKFSRVNDLLKQGLTRLGKVLDGTSATIVIGEDAGRDVSGQPNNRYRPMSETQPFPTTGATAGNNAGANDELFSYHPGGVNCLFGDGSVHFLRDSISLTILRKLITAAGNEVLSQGEY